MDPRNSSYLRLRGATATDAEVLASFAEKTFRDAFAYANTTEDMDAYARVAFAVDTIREEIRDESSTFLLAFSASRDEPVGYLKLRQGSAHDSVTGPDPIELQRIYVDPSVIGQGLGAAILEAGMHAARAGGFSTLWLGVWRHNDRAIAFYHQWGFETVGRLVFRLGSDVQHGLVMQRAV